MMIKYVFYGITGENSTPMLFNGNTKLSLKSLNEYCDTNAYVDSFKISCRFKPYSITYDKFLSIDDDNVNIILMNNIQEYDDYNQSTQYIALFTVGNHAYTCSFGIGLTIGEYNTLELQFSQDTFSVYINAQTTKLACGDW